jgi:hypothetical protein
VAEEEIRRHRAASCRALAMHDVAGMATHWLRDLCVTNSDGSITDDYDGWMTESVAAHPDVCFNRIPHRIEMDCPGPIGAIKHPLSSLSHSENSLYGSVGAQGAQEPCSAVSGPGSGVRHGRLRGRAGPLAGQLVHRGRAPLGEPLRAVLRPVAPLRRARTLAHQRGGQRAGVTTCTTFIISCL